MNELFEKKRERNRDSFIKSRLAILIPSEIEVEKKCRDTTREITQ